MTQLTRRTALRTSAAALAGAALSPLSARAFFQGRSPNEDVRVAVVGVGGRGGSHIADFSAAPGARLVAVCDADEAVVSKRADSLQKKLGTQVDAVLDYRELLDRDDIDVVTFATPNHWHALMTIQACQAGKHVYVEKPVCHTIWEGRRMIEAMQKYNRIVGSGFQNRSDVGLREAFGLIHEGKLGSIRQARGLCYRDRGSIGKRDTPLTPPASVNYDLWLGPAADLPIMRPKFHYDWHWVFNTGNGDMGNQGPHEMDLLQWVLGEPGHPRRIMSFGGRFGWDDAGDTPNMQFASFDFGNGVPVIFEVRNLHQKDNPKLGRFSRGPGVGIIVTCENGEFRGGRGGGSFYDNDGHETQKFKGDAGKTHMANFVNAVRNSDPDSLRAPLENAFHSSCMSHLANISVRTGQPATRAEVAERITGNDLAMETFERFSAQLDAWSVDTKQTPWNVGPDLQFDPLKEVFTDGEQAAAANALVRRVDRKPYIVPEVV